MSALFRPSPERAGIGRLDLGLLDIRDRACLRLLRRIEVATPDQLAILIYPSRRTAFRHLRRLWQLGLLERAPLPPIRGGIPVAYRLTRRGMNRLGYPDPRTGGLAHLRHALDTVAAVCALVRPRTHPAEGHAVQLWLSESTAADAGVEPTRPDSVVVLQVDGRTGVLCLETDEATEHAPQIKAKLAAYERVLADRVSWHVLFVVPTTARLSWLRRVARPDLFGRGWGVVLVDLESHGLDAPVVPLSRSGQPRGLRSVLDDPRPRRSATPVGSDAWIELLGSGGGEELNEVLR
jgi:Replication-relaxation